MKKQIKWESFEDAKLRIEREEILKKLQDPNLSAEEKNRLLEILYADIEIKTK